jgi:hypothetical protein
VGEENQQVEALKKNEEWQGLAEENQRKVEELAGRIAELEPLGEKVTRYMGALEKYLEAEKKDLPRYVLVLLEKMDPVDQIEYLSANRGELGKRAAVGVPASPEAKERTLSEDDLERARRAQANLYSNF